MEKDLTSMDIERILMEYEKELSNRTDDQEEEGEWESFEMNGDTQILDRILAGLFLQKVSLLKNKDYYAAKLMQLFKLTVLLLNEEYLLEEPLRKSCMQYLMRELRDDLVDVIQIIDTLPDMKPRHTPS